MVKRRVIYAKSAVLLSPINKVLGLQRCIDCLWNYTRMYGCYLTCETSLVVWKDKDPLVLLQYHTSQFLMMLLCNLMLAKIPIF